MNKGCGKFKLSTTIFGGWCGITKHIFGTDVGYCKCCVKKFVEEYKGNDANEVDSEVKK